MAYFIPTAAEQVATAEVAEVDLYHPKSFVTKYVFSQEGQREEPAGDARPTTAAPGAATPIHEWITWRATNRSS